jgi:hypothetical protein
LQDVEEVPTVTKVFGTIAAGVVVVPEAVTALFVTTELLLTTAVLDVLRLEEAEAEAVTVRPWPKAAIGRRAKMVLEACILIFGAKGLVLVVVWFVRMWF